jgi:hypothetical protein
MRHNPLILAVRFCRAGYGSPSQKYLKRGTVVIFDLMLPEGCPKAVVEEFEGTAYRVVRTDPPTSDDLLTYLELELLQTADTCRRASISLFLTLDQARHRLEISPHLGCFIASVSLTTAHGRVSTPSKLGHIDWWPYAGMRNPVDLQVVEQ